MNTIFKKSLEKLLSLSADALRGYCCRFRTDLGSAEWKMGLGLLALKRTGAFRELGYSTLSDFAERALSLSGRKVGQLLGAAEALEHLPVLSEAYRKGEIGWGKVRAIHGLATPETEEEWLRFAAAHGTEEVARKVALSPRNWKRHNALKASLGGKPIATTDMVREVLARPLPTKVGLAENLALETDRSEGASASNPESLPVSTEAATPAPSILECKSEYPAVSAQAPVAECGPIQLTASPLPPTHSKKIRFTVEMDADDYAVFEQAETRIRARAGRRLRRSKVLLKMAEAVLSEGTAKDRARHQVIIHTVEDAEGGWYETDRGVLPASPEVVQEALQSGHVLKAEELIGISGEGHGDGASSSQNERKGANPLGDSSSSDRAQGIDRNPPGFHRVTTAPRASTRIPPGILRETTASRALKRIPWGTPRTKVPGASKQTLSAIPPLTGRATRTPKGIHPATTSPRTPTPIPQGIHPHPPPIPTKTSSSKESPSPTPPSENSTPEPTNAANAARPPVAAYISTTAPRSAREAETAG